jgi:hypothetical protein
VPPAVRVRAAVVWVLLGALPSGGAAQGSQPLRKTDVIRLLSNPLISKSEVADLIRRDCVAFQPTPRDWADLRDFGADAAVLSSIGGCAAAPGRARGPDQPPLTAALLTERVTVPAGGAIVARVQVKRGAVPQAGIPLVLRGSARIPGGPAQDARANTAAEGVALFQFPVGRVPGTYHVDVITGSGFAFAGTPPLEIVVAAAPPASAEAQPGRVEVRAGERGPVSVAVVVHDSGGNPVVGEAVTTQPEGPDMGVSSESHSTDSLGRAVFTLERSAVHRGGRVTFRVRGRALAAVELVRADVAAAATTGFVAGTGQQGIARTRLSEPLVLQVRSAAGAPIPGKVVTFRAVNAEVAPDSAVSDSAGLARAEATLGKQAGPALVTATVDSIQKQAVLRVEPAAPAGVVIERDGMRVDGGTTAVATGSVFRIRVSTQDAFGNPVPTADLARLIQQMRNGFNAQSQLLKMTSVESDGGAALVTFRAFGVGQSDLSIAGATVSVQIVATR